MTTEIRKSYRPAEVASLLGCSRDLVFKLMREGKLRGFRIGASRFFSASEISDFVEAREREEEQG